MDKIDNIALKCINYVDDVTRIILEYIFHAIELIERSQADMGLEIMKKCDEILLAASKQNILINTDVLTLIPHTYSLYFFQYILCSIQDYHNASIYLFKSIQIFKQKLVPSKPQQLILYNRVLCSLHLQLYGIYLTIENHELSLAHAKEAFKRSEEILRNCTFICNEHLHRHKNLFNCVYFT